MKKIRILDFDSIQKEELLSLKGGADGGGDKKKCPCICVGPLEPGDGDDDGEQDTSEDGGQTSDGDCTDCGASNAARVLNP